MLMMHFMMMLRIIIFIILIPPLIAKIYIGHDFVTKPIDEASVIKGYPNVNTLINNIHETVKSDEEIYKAQKEKLISAFIALIIILCILLLLTALGQLCPWKYVTCQCERGCIRRNWRRFKNCFSNCCRQCYRNFCNVNLGNHSEATDPQVVYYGDNVVSIQQQI